MELDDCAFPLLEGVVVTSEKEVAFKDIDVALMVGAMPRKKGMERKDLLSANVAIFKDQGEALDKFAKKSVLVAVVGNPANTNACIMSHYSPSIPKKNFSALTRLDSNRATSMLAKRLKVPVDTVTKCIIWGNHSNTQFVDATAATCPGPAGDKVTAKLNDDNWLKNTFLPAIQTRGAKVIELREKSSAMSAAKAVTDHMHDWWHGTKKEEWVVMSVSSDGSYNVPKDLMFSFPVTISNKEWKIVKDIPMDEWAQAQFKKTLNELEEERKIALEACK